MGIIEALEEQSGIDVLSMDFNSAEYLHVLIEAFRLAFAGESCFFLYPKIYDANASI